MPNDEGVVQPYEEIWRDLPVSPSISTVLVARKASEDQDSDDGDMATKPPSSTETCGIIIRIGSWCQGILQHKDKVSVERCELEGTQWRCIARHGEELVPCWYTFLESTATSKSIKGQTADGTKLIWTVSHEEGKIH